MTKSSDLPKNKGLYKCDLCNDTGYIIKSQEHSQDIMTPCRCLEIEKAKQIWKNSGINSSDIDKSLDNFETWNDKSKEMKIKATKYLLRFDEIKKERRNSVLFCGNPGSGKTHLAIAIATTLLNKRNKKVIYMPYRDIVTSLKQNMLDEEYYKKMISKYQTAEVLLIDDLYKGKITEADINIIFELINYRYLNKLPVIVSTEHNIDKLLEIDEAIGSRIYEMSKDFMVEIKRGIENNYRLR